MEKVKIFNEIILKVKNFSLSERSLLGFGNFPFQKNTKLLKVKNIPKPKSENFQGEGIYNLFE